MMLNDLQTAMSAPMKDRKLFEQAKSSALDYMETVPERNVYPDREAIAALAAFDEAMPESPGNPE